MKKAILAIMVVTLILAAASVAGAANSTVTVGAQANGKLTLSVDNPTVTFPAIDPGTPDSIANAVTVSVSSNKGFTTTKTITDADANGPMGLSTAGFVVSAANAKGDYTWPETYSINIPWTATPDVPLSASVLYTALQN